MKQSNSDCLDNPSENEQYDCMDFRVFHFVADLLCFNYFVVFRLLWFLVLIACGSLFVYIMAVRLVLFSQYTTNTNVEIAYVDKLAFPAVTVCNHNQFRYTAATLAS